LTKKAATMTIATKSPGKARARASKAREEIPAFLSRAERLAAGHTVRDRVPRGSHADWATSGSPGRGGAAFGPQRNRTDFV
jgi:hypothetical protein